MENVSINQSIHLSEHFTLGEVTKSKYTEVYNIPSHEAIENLKRVCEWLEELRRRYNLRYVLRSVSPPKLGGARGGLNERYNSHCSDRPTHTGTPPNLGGEKDTEEPIIISSGYRSPQLNRKQDYDEILIERNRSGGYWLHFAVRPKDNRRKTMFLQK